MKIAFLTSEYPIEGATATGGIGTSIRNLAEGLSELGNEIIIFLYGQKQERKIKSGNIQIICIKNPYFPGLSWLLLRLKLKRIINQAYHNGQLNLLEVNDWTGISAYLKVNCPMVMRLHGTDSMFCKIEGRKPKFWNYTLEKNAFKKSTHIIAVSRFVGEQNNLAFNLTKEYTVIPNTLGKKTSTTQTSVSQTNTMLYFGTIVRKKGVLELPLIFNLVIQQLPEVKLILAGRDTPDKTTGNASTWEMMKTLFNKDALAKVSYLGELPFDKVHAVIETSTVVLFPSYAEALPMSWIEAMQMKKAIVASSIGWANEMIQHGASGLLCHPSDHQEWANCIIQLLNSPEKRISLGEAAFKTSALLFGRELVLQKNIQYYQSIIGQSI